MSSVEVRVSHGDIYSVAARTSMINFDSQQLLNIETALIKLFDVAVAVSSKTEVRQIIADALESTKTMCLRGEIQRVSHRYSVAQSAKGEIFIPSAVIERELRHVSKGDVVNFIVRDSGRGKNGCPWRAVKATRDTEHSDDGWKTVTRKK